jgi:hypothetical protein
MGRERVELGPDTIAVAIAQGDTCNALREGRAAR